MIFSHPFSKYGLAFIMQNENINDISLISKESIIKHLKIGLSHFRMYSRNNPEIEDYLNFEYIPMQFIIDNSIKGDPERGIYLCPNIITKDIKANNTWIAMTSLIVLIENVSNNLKLKETSTKLTMGIAPIAGELNNGKKTKSNAKSSILEVACCAITNTTPYKPYLAYKEIDSKGKIAYIPTVIIPDLEIEEMKDFIELFNKILTSMTPSDLMQKKVFRESEQEDKTKKKSKIKPKYSRPKIYDSNFPDAPKSSAMGSIGLLAAIGKWAQEANETIWAHRVLDSLKNKPIYLISYGNATVTTYNHYIVDLAKENKLGNIIKNIYNTELLKGKRTEIYKDKDLKTKYDLFDLLSSRFLQFFSPPYFKDFLAIRGEYKTGLELLFTTYFEKIMNIKPEIINSAKELGLWLNYVAYKVAETETKGKPNQKDEQKKHKAKVLTELESSAFSAKSGTALISQTVTRAGRLSGMDAPAKADIFMQATASGEIELNDAKNLITAFSRLRNRFESSEPPHIEKEVDNIIDDYNSN